MLPGAYNLSTILDSAWRAASAQYLCPLAECDSAGRLEQMSPQLDTFPPDRLVKLGGQARSYTLSPSIPRAGVCGPICLRTGLPFDGVHFISLWLNTLRNRVYLDGEVQGHSTTSQCSRLVQLPPALGLPRVSPNPSLQCSYRL